MNAIPVARSRPITGLLSLWCSTIGKKYVMAISGLIWFGYLIVHLWGNLNIYAGPVFLNTYGDWLSTVGEPFLGYSQFLWLARIILIPAFVVHVWAAVQLTSRDRAKSAPRLLNAPKRRVDLRQSDDDLRWAVRPALLIYHCSTLHSARSIRRI